MPSYDLRCADGHRAAVHLPSMFSDNPPCTECGQPTARIPAMGRVVGLASALIPARRAARMDPVQAIRS